MEEQYENRIDAYFKHTLSAAERIRFEEEIINNPGLQRLVEEYKLGMDAVDLEEEEALRAKYTGWKQDRKQQQKRLYTIVISSAAACMAILAGLYFLIRPVSESNEMIAFHAYTLPDTPGSTMGTIDEKWSAGAAAYKTKSFGKAIEEWESIEEKTPEVDYYLAHCYFNTHEYDKAIPLFRELSAGTSVYSYSSEWYLTLAYLASDNTNESIKELDTILENKNHPFYARAQQLKERMKI